MNVFKWIRIPRRTFYCYAPSRLEEKLFGGFTLSFTPCPFYKHEAISKDILLGRCSYSGLEITDMVKECGYRYPSGKDIFK